MVSSQAASRKGSAHTKPRMLIALRTPLSPHKLTQVHNPGEKMGQAINPELCSNAVARRAHVSDHHPLTPSPPRDGTVSYFCGVLMTKCTVSPSLIPC